MSIITTLPPPNFWEQICEESERERAQLMGEEEKSVPIDIENFDASKHHPAFYGKPFAHIDSDFNLKTELNQSIGQPACAGYWFAESPVETSRSVSKPVPDIKTCRNRDFLEHYVWPCLLPALESMLVEAQLQGSFGLKRVPFNSIDYLTEYLYNQNPMHQGERGEVALFDIPFVKSWLELHPRPPQPISLTWTEDETATKIQCAWRGYVVRRDPEVQELRKWQEEWRFINREGQIQEEVSGFWERMMPSHSTFSASQTMGSSSYPFVTGSSFHKIRGSSSKHPPTGSLSATVPVSESSPSSVNQQHQHQQH